MEDMKFWFHEEIYSRFESSNRRAWRFVQGCLSSTPGFAEIPDLKLLFFYPF